MDPLDQLWLSYYSGILKHLPKSLLIELAKIVVIPKELLYYEYRKALICVSCQFMMGHKSSSRGRNSSYKPIRKEDHDAPSTCATTNQLISIQLVLVPQTWESLTRVRIWEDNIVVDHYTDIHKAVLFRSHSTEETLATKLGTEKVFHATWGEH